MADAWLLSSISTAMTKQQLSELALSVPMEYRPSGYGGKITKAELIEFMRKARMAYYDAPAPKKPRAKQKLCEVPAGEVNKMLLGFPPVSTF